MVHPGGRPTSYKKEYCQMLIDHMAGGLSYETFGATIDVSRAVLYDWEKVHPEFLDAKKEGFERCQLWFEMAGKQQILKGKGNSSTWIFSMKNRFKWKDNHEPLGDENSPINIVIKERIKNEND